MALTREQKEVATFVQDAIRAAVAKAYEQLGIQVKVGRSSGSIGIGDSTFSINVLMLDEGARQKKYTMEVAHSQMAHVPFNAPFTNAGVEYRIVGANWRKRTMPVLAERASDGKTFCFPLAVITRHFPLPQVQS